MDEDCYDRIIPGCYGGVGICDYAMLRFRSDLAWCTLADYDVGYFGYATPGSTGATTNQGSYPGSPPSGPGYPSYWYQERDDGWTNGSGNTYHLRYRNDTLGGSSGSPVFNDSGQVHAIHSDSCGSGMCAWNYGMAVSASVATFIQNEAGY